MSIIKEYQLIVAALIIACSIYAVANMNNYKYVSIGETGVMVLKNGEIDRFCELAFDACYYRDRSNQYWLKPMNLRELLEESATEEQQWQLQKQEYFKRQLQHN